MKFEEFKTQLENIWNEKFPKSKIVVEFNSNLGKNIFVHTYLANDRSELSYGYYDNDMIKNRFMITTFNNENELNNFEVFSATCGFNTKPENEYLYCSYHNIRFTKKKSETVDGFIKKFKKYVDTLYNDIIDCYNNDTIHSNYKKLVEEKIINVKAGA